MKTFVLATVACICGVLPVGSIQAQSARLDVKAVSDAAVQSQMPELVKRGTKTDASAPKLRLDATVVSSAGAAVAASIEWYVFGRITEEGKQAGRTAPDLVVMQSSKEAITAKPAPGSRTSFFAYAPGQTWNGTKGEGWIVRLVNANGVLLDAKASTGPYLALARDGARLAALVASKKGAGASAAGDGDIPLEVLAKIKAEAEKNWPGNPEMQAFEIKNKVDAHKAAYQK